MPDQNTYCGKSVCDKKLYRGLRINPPSYPFGMYLGCTYRGMRLWERRGVKPAGKRGEEQNLIRSIRQVNDAREKQTLNR